MRRRTLALTRSHGKRAPAADSFVVVDAIVETKNDKKKACGTS
jgi:hypothetical protein